MTLLQQIETAKQELWKRYAAVDAQQKIVRALEDSRIDCKHVFSPPFVGYEHEGGHCTLCGINELYNHTLQRIR